LGLSVIDVQESVEAWSQVQGGTGIPEPTVRICRENPCSNDEACQGMLVGMPKYLSTANTRPKPKPAGH